MDASFATRELLGDGFEFREVLDSRFILRIGRLLQFADVPGLL